MLQLSVNVVFENEMFQNMQYTISKLLYLFKRKFSLPLTFRVTPNSSVVCLPIGLGLGHAGLGFGLRLGFGLGLAVFTTTQPIRSTLKFLLFI